MYDARMVTGRLDVTSGRYTGMCCIVETDSKTVTDARPRILRTDGRGGQRGQQPSPATAVERYGKLARVGPAELDRGGAAGAPGAALCMGGDL